MQKTRQRVRSGPADVDEPEPDSKRSLAAKVVRGLDSSFTPSPSNQHSAPPTDLGIHALRSGRHIGRESDLKILFWLSTWTAVNSSGKCDLAAMAEADELHGPVEARKPPREVASGVPILESSIESRPDRLHEEINQSRQPTATPSPPNSPPLLAPIPSHDLASAASAQLELRTSPEYLLMLASGAQQPVDTSVTQVRTPSRSHSPSNLCTEDALVDMATADAGRKLGPAGSSRATPSEYFTPGKLGVQVPGLSSALWAAGPTALSAETDLRSPFRFVSKHSVR